MGLMGQIEGVVSAVSFLEAVGKTLFSYLFQIPEPRTSCGLWPLPAPSRPATP